MALAAQFVITQVTRLLTFLKVWPARTLVVAGSKVDESEYGRVSVILSVLGNSRRGGGLVKTCVRTDSPIALVHNAFANQDPEDDIDGPTYHGSGSGGVTGGVGSRVRLPAIWVAAACRSKYGGASEGGAKSWE